MTSTNKSRSVYLKAYHCPDGREIHYAVARLRREPDSPTSILDADDPGDRASSEPIGACWIFFYPMGPNRRLLEAVISRYAPRFECDGDVLFLCVNRPGKGGTSPPPSVAASSSAAEEEEEQQQQQQQHREGRAPDERRHVRAAGDDCRAILDFYGARRASLLYMCAGSTFAYSFASRHPDRATGHVVGIASWVLRSDPSSYLASNCGEGDESGRCDVKTPMMHSLTHRMAMDGYFGPKWWVSYLAGGITGSVGAVFGSVSPEWVGKVLKKELSHDEKLEFDERYPDGIEFAELMKWIHDDGYDEEVSMPVNEDNGETSREHAKNGDARDCAVCLSTQQDLGLIYKNTVPPQRQVLLWHGESDRMISIAGADYLASMLPNATLTRVSQGTHQGTMFFFPKDAMEALNRISRDVSASMK